jgi:hypothetical protein
MRTRRIFVILLGVLLIVPELPAKTSDDWTKIAKLAWDTPVLMELWSGQEYVGRFHSADDRFLRLKVRNGSGGPVEIREFSRLQVRIVERLEGTQHDPYAFLRGGQLIGAAGGAIAAGIATGRAWPLGAMIGGLGGMAAGSLFGGAVGLVMMNGNHRRKILYESHQPPAVARPPASSILRSTPGDRSALGRGEPPTPGLKDVDVRVAAVHNPGTASESDAHLRGTGDDGSVSVEPHF